MQKREQQQKLKDLNREYNKKDHLKTQMQQQRQSDMLTLKEINHLRQMDAYSNRVLQQNFMLCDKAKYLQKYLNRKE